MNGTAWRELEEESLAMIRIAAPFEFDRANLYLCDTGRMSGTDAACKTMYGMTGPDYDALVEPFVEWRGRGHAVIFSRRAIEEDGRGEPGAVRMLLLSLLVHEWSHVLREGYPAALKKPRQMLVDADMVSFARSSVIDDIKREKRGAPAANRRVAKGIADLELRHHDAAWVRTCCHVKHRIEARLGELLPLSQIVHRSYGPQACFYGHALGDEQTRCAAWPIEAILALPLPDAFAETWGRAVKDCHAIEEGKFMDAQMQAEAARVLHEANQSRRIGNPVAGGMVPSPALPEPTPTIEVDMSALSSWFTKVGEAFSRKKHTIAQDFAALVRDVANGKTPRPEDAERVLDAAHKTPAQLQEAVERILRRREQRRTMDAAIALPPKRAEIADKVAEVEGKFSKAIQEHDARTWELACAEREIDTAQKAADNAKIELERSADPERLAALKEAELPRGQIQTALRLAQIKLREAQEAVKFYSPTVRAAQQHYREGNTEGKTDAWKGLGFPDIDAFNVAIGNLTPAERELAALPADIERLTRELADADKAVDAARLALLDV